MIPKSSKTPIVMYQRAACTVAITAMLLLRGCEKKVQQKVEDLPASSAASQAIAQQLAVQAQIEPMVYQLPECKGKNCPEIDIQHLKSNYPWIDQAVDRNIIQYVQNLVRGFDVDSSTKASSADGSQTASSDSTPVVSLSERQNGKNTANKTADELLQNQKRLQEAVNKFLYLSEEVKSLGGSGQLNLYVKPQVLNPSGPVVTVVINASNYMGGAHGSSQQKYLNFDLDKQSMLSLDQILIAGKRKSLNDLAYHAFEQWVKETQSDTDFKTYQQLWKFSVSDNFYLSPQGLILQYDEYEIGPYAVGLPRLVIPYPQLQGIVKDDYLPQQYRAAVDKTQKTT